MMKKALLISLLTATGFAHSAATGTNNFSGELTASTFDAGNTDDGRNEIQVGNTV